MQTEPRDQQDVPAAARMADKQITIEITMISDDYSQATSAFLSVGVYLLLVALAAIDIVLYGGRMMSWAGL